MSLLGRLLFIASLFTAIVALGVPNWQVVLEEKLPTWMTSSFAQTSFSLPKASIEQGTLIGTVINEAGFDKPVEAFLGVPYALPPTGDRRFRPAVPVAASNETIAAQEFGPRCPGKQLLSLPGAVKAENEDCLTLNVFRPKGTQPGQSLPVAIYVHGGAYNRGTASMHKSAQMLSWSEEPFVLVSFNYRLGALGFLPSTLSQKEGILNLGLKDQVLVFEWVKANIEKFGGNPDEVTLFGLSAGAHSIGHHVMNYEEKAPLFHRVIIESGAATSRAVHPYNGQLHETQFSEFLIEASCSDLPESEIMTCLRSAPSKAITEASETIFTKYNPSVRWAFQPVIDQDIIATRPIDAWTSGKWNKMPIMTGFNHNEGTMYVPSSLSTSEEFTSFFTTLLPAFSASDIAKINALYPDPSLDEASPYKETRPIEVGAQYKRVEAAYAHYAYVCPVRQTAHLASPEQESPVFLYHWALNKTVKGGANHADQMEYETMSVLDISPSQKEVAETFHAYVTSFITKGDPNAVQGRQKDRDVWKAYDVKEPKVMIFGEGNDERAGGDSLGVAAKLNDDVWAKEECDFWWEKVPLSEK